jgi:hypothetical protein
MHIPIFDLQNHIVFLVLQSRKNSPKVMTEDSWSGCVDGFCKILKISNGFFYQRQTCLLHQPAQAGLPRIRSCVAGDTLQDYVFDFVSKFILNRADQIPNADHSVLRLQLPVSTTLTSLWHDYKKHHLADVSNTSCKVASWVSHCVKPLLIFPFSSLISLSLSLSLSLSFTLA